MKSLIRLPLVLLFLLCTPNSYALPFSEKNMAINHLIEINAMWKNCKNVAPNQTISFVSDADRINFHLVLVEKYLRNNTPAGLTKKARINRYKLLDHLQTYATKKIFPANTYHKNRTPYFIDNYGVYCAVGELIKVSGNNELALEINKNHRYDFIKNIKTKGLKEWAEKYGFSVDELAWIQPGYQADTKFNKIPGNPNGRIQKMKYVNYDGRLYFTGEFDSVNNLPCLKIGYYNKGQMACLGSGIDGIISDFEINDKGVILSGAFDHNDTIYPLAVYKDNTWKFIKIPAYKNSVGNAMFGGGRNMELVITNPDKPGFQEFWNEQNDGSWKKIATVNGVVNDIEASALGRIYVGAFSKVIIPGESNTTTEMDVNNVVFLTNYTDEFFGIGTQVSDTIHVVKRIGSAIYFGGVCSNENGRSNICFSRYMNDDLQPLILKEEYSHLKDWAVYDFNKYSESELIVAGNFDISPDIGTYGSNLLTYNILYNYYEAIAGFNEKVTGVANYNDSWYVGGHFTKNYKFNEIKYLAEFGNTTSINDHSQNSRVLNIYPNPAYNNISINALNENFSINDIKIYDLQGKLITRQKINSGNNQTIDVSTFNAGLYVLKISDKNGQTQIRKFEVIR